MCGMPGKDGLTLLGELADRATIMPVIMMTGHGDVPMAVKAMKLGALDFVEKPFDTALMMAAVRAALRSNKPATTPASIDPDLVRKIERLTPRERDVMQHLIIGRSNKEIGLELGISPRTVEIHRARLMEEDGCRQSGATHPHGDGRRDRDAPRQSAGRLTPPTSPTSPRMFQHIRQAA